jgi:hypothetical protein
MQAGIPNNLQTKYISGKSWGISQVIGSLHAHEFCSFIDNAGQMCEVADLAVKGAQPGLFIFRARDVGDNSSGVPTILWLVAKDNFRGKPSTNSVLARKGDSTDPL